MRTRLALPLVVLAVAVAGCAGTSDPAATPSSSAVTGPSPTTAPSPTAAPTATAAPSPTGPVVGQTIAITYAGGKVTGGGLVTVKLNTTVALTVTSDVADQVHFHGYDKSADVAKGGTATIVFKADKPGRFVVELEKLGRRLVTLQIQ